MVNIENQPQSSRGTASKPNSGFNVTGLNSLSVGVVYFVLLAALFILLESIMPSGGYPDELKWVVTSLGALFLTIWLALTRGAKRDLEDIVSYGGPLVRMNTLFSQPTRVFRLLETGCGVSLGYTVSFSGRAISTGIPFMSAFTSPFDDYQFGFVTGFYSTLVSLTFIVAGICIVRTVTFLYRQIGLFYESANNIQIDLLNPGPLAVYASQPLRVFFGLMGTTTAMTMIFTTSDELAKTAIPIGIPMITLMTILLVLVSIPLIKIRNRLREEKTKEFLLISKALAGDRAALSSSRISANQHEFQMPDLLYYQDRIQSVWEWPLHTHVRRIAFYVILPPLAWVLAALVESFVETALQ